MDPQKRTEIEQMMRRDVASGNIGVKIKMPGENNSDELNDITNYAPTSAYTTYDTGRRDEAGNPIMSSDVMDLMMSQSYEPPKESDWSVSNIADSVYTMLRDRFHDGSVEPVDFDNPYYTKDMTAPPEPITGKDLIKGAMPDSFQASKLYADYFYGEDEKREQIKKAHDLTGIRVETIANDPDVWEKVMKIVQRAEKLKKVPGMLDANGDLNMRRVYEAMPYLKEIVEKRGTNEAVMMLQNAEGLRTVDDAYSNEYTRFWGSVQTGLKRGGYNILKQFTHAKAMIGRRKLTESENEYVAYLEKQKEELPDYSYGGVGQAVGSMIGSAAENIPMIASAQGIGAVAGGITLAVTKNPGAAANVGRAAAIAVMGLEIGGSQYEENLNKLDANGRAMYTPTQAAALSATQGLAEGVIEQLALQKIARTVFGRGDAKSLRDLYAGAGAKDLALAAEGATANEAARTLIKERILGAAKAGAITFNTELQEEFAQQVSDMVIENMAQMTIKGDDAEISSVRQILQKSTAAAIEAAPSIMGFGLIGFGGHVGAHTRPMLNARSHMENLIKDRLYRSVNENQHLMNTVEAVGDNLKNVQELQGKAPDLVNEMLDSQNRRYGMETTSVDIISLNQEEGGAELVQEIAAANNISAEELQACADGTGMLPVKTSTLQQMTANLDDGKRKALFQNITKSSDLFTDKQAQHEAKIVKEVLSAFQSKTEEEVGDSIDRYVDSVFAEHYHRALARDILLADVNHPAAEIKRRMNRLDADLTEMTAVQNDGSAEAAEYLAQIQPEIEKINAQKDALEAVAGTIKGLQPGDVVATAELSPEARGVYHELAGQLGGAKSKKARTAARASALLAARYADRMAAIYSEVNGEPYTAADYMRDHLRVDAYADDQKKEAAKKKAEIVKGFIDENFPDANEREMAVAATLQDAVSPAKGWRTLYKDIVSERDELLRPALDALDRGMGNGVDIVPIDDDGRGIRVSNNEPWYRDFYKEHGRAPRKGELIDLAYLLTVGDSSAPQVDGWMPSSQGAVDAMQEARAQLDELNGYIQTLENIKERMMQMDVVAGSVYAQSTNVPSEQKDAVRKQYEGSAQWMKAPNGEETNLTEDQWLAVRTPAFKAWFGDWEADSTVASKVLDENGEPKVVYHGTKRKDRVGSVFRKERATSGPMAYFTDLYSVAEGYSQSKEDTSDEGRPYEEQFRIKMKNGQDIPLYQYWGYLPFAKRNEIISAARHITEDDDGNIVYDEDTNDGLGNFSYALKRFGNNGIRALEEGWLNGGALFGNEQDFLEVLKLASVDEKTFEGMYYADPNYTEEGVFHVFMSMKNPFDTSKHVTKMFIRSLRAAAKKAPRALYEQGVDVWDKNSFDPMEYVDMVEEDLKNGTAYAWTTIPDWVTSLLQKKGYDGIRDTGGKHGGAEHTVYIPFEPNQIKSVDNSGAFSADDANIYHQSAWHGTPHDFREFLLEMIGTGEGAQAHGWGLYFAKRRGVSERYKETLKRSVLPRMLYDGKDGHELEGDIKDVYNLIGGMINRKKEGVEDTESLKKSVSRVIQTIKKAAKRNRKELADVEKAIAILKENPNISLEELEKNFDQKSYDALEHHRVLV